MIRSSHRNRVKLAVGCGNNVEVDGASEVTLHVAKPEKADGRALGDRGIQHYAFRWLLTEGARRHEYNNGKQE